MLTLSFAKETDLEEVTDVLPPVKCVKVCTSYVMTIYMEKIV